MKYLSVCSGIEAATVAWHPLGWEPVGFSEIERFPSSVLAHHYPDVPNFGDMNDHKNWPRTDIDVLVGGTPCQSFSVAGLRAGMASPNGNLALVYVAMVARYRPTWFVWENVPGVLSSDEGRDFGSLIGAMVELGYGIAYRVLDAQYFGVPQRRRRVFVVGCSGGWERAVQVLFEPESLLRHPPPSRSQGQGAADGPAKSIRGNSGGIDRVVPPITGYPKGDNASREGQLIPHVANPLTARMHKGINTTLDEGQTPIVVHGTQDPDVSDQAFPLGRNSGQENALAIRTAQTGANGIGVAEEVSHTLDGTQGQAVAFTASDMSNKAAWESEVNPTLNAQPRNDTSNIQYGIRQEMAVRRLTPLECERLQGFPDGYTDVPGASDSGRYKALGNSMAVPVMHWIGERIAAAESVDDHPRKGYSGPMGQSL